MAFAASLAGTAASAYGQYAQGQAARAEARYNQGVARRQSDAIEAKTKVDQIRQQMRARKIKGATAAKLGASGTRLDEGINPAIMAEEAFELAYENALIGAEGRIAARGALSQAEVFRARGENAQTAANIRATGTLLQGVGAMDEFGMWEEFGDNLFAKKKLAGGLPATAGSDFIS